MPAPRSYHLSPDDFRRYGHALVDWIADYQERVGDLPVRATVEPGQIRGMLPAAAPEAPEPLDAVLADINRVILPGITHWQSPNFFAFFPANASAPSILGDLVSSGLAVNGMLWATSPACTELETQVLDWLVDALALPRTFHSDGDGGGVIQDSASSAALCALLAGRERAIASGAPLDRLTVYASKHAHSSFEKAARIAAIANSRVRLIEVDDMHAMRVDALSAAIDDDRSAGLVPCFVLATAGTTSSLAFDPVADIGLVARDCGAWLHVDAAMAGSAAICAELRWVNDGVELADSYCFNPHKWLFTNFDCDCFWVRDRRALTDALSVATEYLRNEASESGDVIDYRDWQIPLGRRFRSLKLWFVLRAYGLEGLRHHIRRHVELTKGFAAQILDDDRFILAAPPALDLVCFRHVAGEEATQRLVADLNSSGRVYLTHTRLDGEYAARVCIGQTYTDAVHVDALWSLIDQLAPAA